MLLAFPAHPFLALERGWRPLASAFANKRSECVGRSERLARCQHLGVDDVAGLTIDEVHDVLESGA